MAIDEALLLRAAVPTVRLYGWRPDAVSIGYFQAAGPVVAAVGDTCWVRRSSGGGAIYHGRDVTYAVVVPRGARPADLYRQVHRLIAAALSALGLATRPGGEAGERAGGRDEPFCFDRRSPVDLLAAGGKLVGSAQRKRAGRVLQHGTIPLEPCPFSQGGTTVGGELGRPVAPEEVAAALKAVWPSHRAGRLTAEEAALSLELARRFRSEAWRYRHRSESGRDFQRSVRQP